MSNGTIPPSQTPRVAVPVSSGGEQVVKIVRLPDALQNVARAQRVEGEVVKQNADGSVRLKTQDGDIDVTVRGRQPQAGQKIEIDIPAGRPPRQAIIRPAAPPPVSIPVTPETGAAPAIRTPVSSPAPAPSSAPSSPPPSAASPPPLSVSSPPTRAGSPVPAPSLPPVLNDVTAPSSSAAAAAPTPLTPGATVRLTPLTPAQAQSLLANYAAALPVIPATLARVQLAASIVTQNITTDMARALLSAPAAALPAASPASIVPLSAPILSPKPESLSGGPFSASAGTMQTVLSPTTPQIFSPSFLMMDKPALTLTPSSLPQAPALSIPNTLSGARAMDVKIISFSSPSVLLSPPGTPPLAAANTAGAPLSTAMPSYPGYMTAQVTGMTPQYLPILSLTPPGQTTAHHFVLQFTVGDNLPVGTSIAVSTLPAATIPAAAAVVPAPLPSTLAGIVSAMTWPALDDLISALAQISPSAAAPLIRSIPAPGQPAQMGPAALLFMAAIRAGDLSGWIGERRIDTLTRAGKTNLLAQLSRDGATLTRVASEPAPGDWRGMMIPLHWQGEVHKVMLYTRRDGSEHSTAEHSGGGQTRFIFDLSLSRMGDIQIDGLARGERLDMVVRSQHPFSPPMQAAMRAAYARALEDTPLHGDLTFQGDPRGWVNVVKRTETVGVEI
jgi:hypothetical protein